MFNLTRKTLVILLLLHKTKFREYYSSVKLEYFSTIIKNNNSAEL